ncbi:MAG TPA: hypothetical protein VFY53_14575 [Rhodoplanes sp.]|nr:hypothetical protein [Rhodoplanes sp.]
MFNWLRKPKPEAGEPSTGEALLTLALDTYARAIEDMLRQDSPAGRAMYVVAYDNLRPLGSAMYTVSIQQNEKPCMVEDLIKFFSRELDRKRDEINIRRFSWYFIAALLARLDKLARKDEGIREHGIECWLMLADSAAHLASLLPNNIVWKTEEKVWYEALWYEALQTKADFTKHVLSHTMPAHYSDHPLIKSFAKQNSIFVPTRKSDYCSIV